MSVFLPPANIALRDAKRPSVFLAGSIEMGAAENWQTDMSFFFQKLGFDVFNPRRDDWDSSWEQKYENPQFYQQVTWELNALEKADLIVMYFAPNTKSPISLLEFGMFAKIGSKMRVICPEEFWRKGNVDIVCDRYGIPLYTNWTTFKLDISEEYTTFSK